jgi:hypothetical protein
MSTRIKALLGLTAAVMSASALFPVAAQAVSVNELETSGCLVDL